jgi:hypothetical protein
MPALSPTMTEGNIASWKIKEGVLSAERSMKYTAAPGRHWLILSDQAIHLLPAM